MAVARCTQDWRTCNVSEQSPRAQINLLQWSYFAWLARGKGPNNVPHSKRVYVIKKAREKKRPPPQFVEVHFVGDKGSTRLLVTLPDKPFEGARIIAATRGVAIGSARFVRG